MRVGEADAPVGGLADMADDIEAFYRMAAHQIRDLRIDAGARIVEGAAAQAFIERDAPAVAVFARAPAPLHQA